MAIKDIYETLEYGPAPESAEIALEWLKDRNEKLDLYVNGVWSAPSSGQHFDSINPANKDVLAKVAHGNKADVDSAVQAASDALKGWKELGSHSRARYLYAIARQIQKHSRLFAVLESLDNGKPIRETRDIDVPLVARHFYHHAGWAQVMDKELEGYEAVGVIGQIIPWNFPLLMLAWKVAPALSMGNTVVLKPAETTSLTALLFADICHQVGLPEGVLNVVTGFGDTGAAIVEHPDINKIAFTGSTEVGKIIRRATAASRKKISLELGGKSPFIVFEDADLDSVVEGVVDAIWFNQGQVCCAGSRLLVQESVAEKLYNRIKDRMSKLRVGDSLDKAIDIGAINSKEQLDRIQELVDLGVKEGSELWQPEWSCPTDGYFFHPSLFTDVAPSATIAQEEIFGPVLVGMTFRTHAEAVKLANNTRYGLAASIWTEDINLALDIAPKVKAGTVWINCTNVFDASSGFGGYRESGFGREGGREGLFEYVKASINQEFSSSPLGVEMSGKNDQPSSNGVPGIDRTRKLYIGGKQARPDGGYSLDVKNPNGMTLGEVGRGNRKDIRNAVEAACKSTAWVDMTGHQRAQVIYYIAENLEARKQEFVSNLIVQLLCSQDHASNEFNKSIERLYTYAAHADKYDGQVHHTTKRNVTLAMPEAVGVLGIICPEEAPLLGFVSTVAPALALGNRVVVIPSEKSPISAADMYQVFDTSDVPGGTINIVTGLKDELVKTLAGHNSVDGIWQFGSEEESTLIKELSADDMKRTWTANGKYRDWFNDDHCDPQTFLRHAAEIKNIWIPYGA